MLDNLNTTVSIVAQNGSGFQSESVKSGKNRYVWCSGVYRASFSISFEKYVKRKKTEGHSR